MAGAGTTPSPGGTLAAPDREPDRVAENRRALGRNQSDDHPELFRHVAFFRSDSTRISDFHNNKTALAGGSVRSRFTIPRRAEPVLLLPGRAPGPPPRPPSSKL